MSLRHSYSFIAPVYDLIVRAATRNARAASLAALRPLPAGLVLLDGVGTGLDLPHLPNHHRYVGADLTDAMLRRAAPRTSRLDWAALQADAMHLPLPDASVDHVVLHLIVAVVPSPLACVQEAARVVKPGGTILVLDKFLRPGQRAPLRRALTPISGRIATRMDVVFEELVAATPVLQIESDEPAALGGWFRRIRLRRLD